MLFSSVTFLFFFLPIGMAIYFLIPWRKIKNIWLLIISLIFYAWGEPVYVVLMIVSIVGNWAFALLIGKAQGRAQSRAQTQLQEKQQNSALENAREKPQSSAQEKSQETAQSSAQKKEKSGKFLLVLACVFNVAIIGFFKYQGFLATNINALFGFELMPNLQLALPIGISFYTLQALSYVIDVYRQEVAPQKNVAFLGMYVACFPQLIAGPIVRYSTIAEQILHRKENLADFVSGLRLFIVGLGKKVLLANIIAILADSMLELGGANIGIVGAWGGLLAYTFQIYFDFAGYSDMAIGLGRMMGFKYLRNFNYPYISKSPREFWRRWHISLSTFFRDYVYIPLGGSRVKMPRWVFNMAIVWALTGIWHGAAWNYILWGVYWGVLLILERLIFGKVISKIPAIFQHIICIALFIFGWSFFWITDMSKLIEWWQAMFGAFGLCGKQTFWQLGVWEYLPIFIACIIASTPIAPWIKERFMAWACGRERVSIFSAAAIANERTLKADSLLVFDNENAKAHPVAAQIFGVVLDIYLLAVLLLSCASIVSGSFNPFIYFQF